MSTDTDKTILGKMETVKHIQSVRSFLYLMIEELDNRARNHDQSKLESPEAEIFGEYTPELIKTKYGSPEYAALLEKVKPATDNHYAKNRHHPEHWPIPNSNAKEIEEYAKELKDDDPAKKWLVEYASSLKSRINNMTLVDLVELLCDWKAATARNKDGNIRTSIDINQKRFDMSSQLAQIFHNTVREMFRE